MDGSIIKGSKHARIMDDELENIRFIKEEEEEDDEESSTNSSSVCSSTSSDFMEDAVTSSSSSCGPLLDMKSLILQLPYKRGLSKHFEGRSQSFTSLSNVKILDDLIKPEKPFKKRRFKPSKSYRWGSNNKSKNSIMKKKTVNLKRSSFSSSLVTIKGNNFWGNRPPGYSPRTHWENKLKLIPIFFIFTWLRHELHKAFRVQSYLQNGLQDSSFGHSI